MNRTTLKGRLIAPDLFLPKQGVDLEKWSVIACDQYTSNPEYWHKLDDLVGDSPSTLRLILPEAFLDQATTHVSQININMRQYLEQGILRPIGQGFILVDRMTAHGNHRLGLMMAVDLEDYDYHEGAQTLVRSTEETIESRIPPRAIIRRQAPIELSHVMLLVNDDTIGMLEQWFKRKAELPLLYDFKLNMEGGHIRGYHIKDVDAVINQFEMLIQNQEEPLLFIAGDGNHSLATAKAHWEAIKLHTTEIEQRDHPARHALVEVVNLYDPGLQFEGIHRVIFDAPPGFESELLSQLEGNQTTWMYRASSGKTEIAIPDNAPLAYEIVQAYIDRHLEENPACEVDYIHGDQALIDICNQHPKSLGIRMPALTKADLFPYIQAGKVLPIKSFSMGAATEKRYYLEAKAITRMATDIIKKENES